MWCACLGITAYMAPWTPVWRWGKKLDIMFYGSSNLFLTLPSHQAPSEWWHPQAGPARLPLSCTAKPSIPRKIKGDLYYACMIYSCCYFLCSRHRWKSIQLDWWRGKTNFCQTTHCEFSCSHRLSFPLPKVSVDPHWVLFEFLIFSLTCTDTFWGVQHTYPVDHTVILL